MLELLVMDEKTLEKMVGAPAAVLDKTVDASQVIAKNLSQGLRIKKAQDYWKTLGPGLTTGAADDDPSGIAIYSQTGAKYGFQYLWLAPLTFPLMAIVQEMCARIGLITGRGLAANIRNFYPRWVLYLCTILLFGANSLNIGADLGAMAKASQLIFPHLNFEFLVLTFTLISLSLQIFTTYEKYAKYLKWLALVLLAYIFSALATHLDFNLLLRSTLIPSLKLNQESIILITAVLGTTISPYLFFWQTSQEVEEEILAGKATLKLRETETTQKEINHMRLDIWSGMFLSNIVMLFIIAAAATTLHINNLTEIQTSADAASALRPLAGEFSFLFYAIGIIGTGLLTLPVLAGSASYAISESMGWKDGLYRKLKEANAFYGVIILSTLVGLAINLTGIDIIKALIYSGLANGIIAPVILVLIVLMSNSRKIMGERVSHPLINLVGWVIVCAMAAAGAATLYILLT